jgi:hypothetical protein
MRKRIIFNVAILIGMFLGIHYYAYLARNSALGIAGNQIADHQETFYKAAIINNSGEFSSIVIFCSLILFGALMYLTSQMKIYYRIPISLMGSVFFIVGVLLFYKNYFAW